MRLTLSISERSRWLVLAKRLRRALRHGLRSLDVEGINKPGDLARSLMTELQAVAGWMEGPLLKIPATAATTKSTPSSLSPSRTRTRQWLERELQRATHQCLASEHWVWVATEVQPGLEPRLALATALRAELEADFPAELAARLLRRLPALGNGHGEKLRAALRTGIRILPGGDHFIARLVTRGRLGLLHESVLEVQAMMDDGATLEMEGASSAEAVACRFHARYVNLSIAWETHELTRDKVKTYKDQDSELYTSMIRTCIPPYYRGVLANSVLLRVQSPRLRAETPTSRRAAGATQKNGPLMDSLNRTAYQPERKILQPLPNN